MWNEHGGNDRRGPEAMELPHAVAEAALPELQPTGHAEVDAALMRLGELSERPVGGHAELYDDVHQRLQDVLAELDRQR
ncbi:MAG TPA: hypothetical protein VGX23_13900 [Actinocrinis sp.]|nr:hypothetical protein [Actinocrinis sp.]